MKIDDGGVKRSAAIALLVVVVGAPAAASWHGLTAAGREALGLPGAWAALVPLVLDAAAAYAAVLALRDVLAGDAAGTNRGLVWLYALASAALNAWHADRVGGLPAASFYALASISAVILWDRTLRATRRDVLRQRGAVAPPTPRFRASRWLVAPRETGQAWRLAVVEGVSDPAEAVSRARALEAPPRALPAAELEGLSKADAVRRAAVELDTWEAGPVCGWLRDRGVECAPSYVHDVARRDRRADTTDSEPGAVVRLAAS